jgi:hypothetical protein
LQTGNTGNQIELALASCLVQDAKKKGFYVAGSDASRLCFRNSPDEVRARLQQIYAGLDPVVLLRNIRATQERLAALADVQPAELAAAAEQPIELFLARLRTAWKDGASRPTDRPIVKAKREHRRPDPFIQVTPDLRRWFEAEPWRSGSELQLRLQTQYPGTYPEKLLRTLQPRLKAWRSETARALLLGSLEKEQEVVEVAMPH